jgi:Uma2 family endonuclease
MKTAIQPALISVEEYLAGEEQSDVRHEYIGGELYAMAGASDDHIAIAMNLATALKGHLRGGPCRVQMSDGKVRLLIAGEDIFYYPDLMVFCDPRDTHRYFKQYPKVLIEVLSRSAETIDRREKSLSYRQIETLEEYVMIAQNKIEITVLRRANQWQPEVLQDREQILQLRSLNFDMPLAAVYEDVKL